MPCGRFGANAAWLRLTVLTYNVLTALKWLALPAELLPARPKRLRFLIFNTPGKLVHHARRTRLRLAWSWQRFSNWQSALRLLSLPDLLTARHREAKLPADPHPHHGLPRCLRTLCPLVTHPLSDTLEPVKRACDKPHTYRSQASPTLSHSPLSVCLTSPSSRYGRITDLFDWLVSLCYLQEFPLLECLPLCAARNRNEKPDGHQVPGSRLS
jgi:hypothetical protein